MRLWHDDVRPPPDETWTWARTNDEAADQLWFNRDQIIEISLDHDLGDDGEGGWNEDAGTGLGLVEWMIDNDLVPEKITIHSWNPDGAHRMAMRFVDAGYECTLAPFRP